MHKKVSLIYTIHDFVAHSKLKLIKSFKYFLITIMSTLDQD